MQLHLTALLGAALATVATADENSLYQICGGDIDRPDVSNFRNPNPDSCMFYIPNTGDGATWTNYNGGTCWLKKGCLSEFTDVRLNAGAASVYRPSGYSTHVAQLTSSPDRDMPGFDIGNAHGGLNDCLEICGANPKCFAFVWTDYNGGTCWLKSRAREWVYRPGAFSYVVARPVGPFGACPPL